MCWLNIKSAWLSGRRKKNIFSLRWRPWKDDLAMMTHVFGNCRCRRKEADHRNFFGNQSASSWTSCPKHWMVGRVTPCAPADGPNRSQNSTIPHNRGAHGVTRPTLSQRPLSQCLAAFLLMTTLAFCSQTDVLQDATQLEEKGRFRQAASILNTALEDQSLLGPQRKTLEFELDRLERIKKDFSFSKDELF